MLPPQATASEAKFTWTPPPHPPRPRPLHATPQSGRYKNPMANAIADFPSTEERLCPTVSLLRQKPRQESNTPEYLRFRCPVSVK